jgi:tetracycline 7-halogenase / FADH2 O2-dependent halogenase
LNFIRKVYQQLQMNEQYDVAILGAGFEGGMLATILACNGIKTVLIDAGTHPRFALGESTVRHTFRMVKIMAERFGVPEFHHEFNSGKAIHTHVSSGFGVKKNFGFIYHREGQNQQPAEANQLVIPPYREGYEAHLFRQDTDAFLTYTAIHHGATVKYMTRVKNVETDKQGVTIQTEKGETIRSRFIADASGGGHVLARLWNLRDTPPRVRLQTRCLFTHMIDVKPYDDLTLPNGVPQAPRRWYEGTCHHLFDGGWLWVIPFNNRPGSTNKCVSVGLSFEMRKFPKPTDITPQQEWEQFLAKYPSIKEQFKDAKLVRDWISSDRLQGSLKQTVGDRWVVMAGGAGSGFLDALFSRGLASSVEVINALAGRLIPAVKEDDFRAERFEYISRVHEINLRNNDKLVFAAYTSFRDFDLWNAWFRVWALGVGLGDLKLASIYNRYKKSHDESLLPDSEEPMGLFYSQHQGFKELFDAGVAKMDEVEAGTTDPKEAARYIFSLVRNAKFNAAADQLGDPNCHYINVGTMKATMKLLAWLVTSAPPEMRDMSFGLLGGSRKPHAASA